MFEKPKNKRLFALVDCNNFYVSCERAFNPDLKNKPVAVLSNNDGCLVARSNEIKALGIPMGAPYFKWKKELDKVGAIILSSNYELYGDMSHRVMETLKEFSPEVEIYSIDEAFLNFERLAVGDLVEYGKKIREKILKWTGIPVSVGIGETKTLAKIASHCAKKDSNSKGVFSLIEAEQIDKTLEKIDVQETWGVGRRLAPKLRLYGIDTMKKLKEIDEFWIKRQFSVMLQRTVLELRGISCIDLANISPANKSIVCSRSFGEPVRDLASMKEAISFYASRAAQKLRSQNCAASTIGVFIKTNPFDEKTYYSNFASSSLEPATNFTPDLLAVCNKLVEQIFVDGKAYKKAGVLILGIIPIEACTNSLFKESDLEKHNKIIQAMNLINRRYGRDSLSFAASGGLKIRWSMKREMRSPSYTTRWSDIIKVK